MPIRWMMAFFGAASLLSVGIAHALAADLDAAAVNEATFVEDGARPDGAQERSPLLVKAQVLLDRARFSPGVIDGWPGDNTVNAIAAFERHHGLEADGKLDARVWDKLTRGDEAPVLVSYEITGEDVAGPFLEKDPEPGDFAYMAKLDALAFNDPVELLAEK
ncbi:MAG: peptidoglycan-binding protein, partial [Alphaproteobacteria bacterium]|nr:peptidoglycan-binding protein [Alphaproteobacteria bacterium]